VLARVVAGAGRWLAPGGAVLFEVGEQQVPVARGLVADAGLRPHVARDPSVGAIVVGGVLTSEV
jgi:release factor glutamine methyltransferase